MTPQQRQDAAYNDVFKAYVESHGNNQATYDEAYDRCNKLVNLARLCFDLSKGFNAPQYAGEYAADAAAIIADADDDEKHLIGCVVAVEAEGE